MREVRKVKNIIRCVFSDILQHYPATSRLNAHLGWRHYSDVESGRLRCDALTVVSKKSSILIIKFSIRKLLSELDIPFDKASLSEIDIEASGSHAHTNRDPNIISVVKADFLEA